MAAVEVNIEITGLALCFLKARARGEEKIWNVAFLSDLYHPLDFKHNDRLVPTQEWRPRGRDIFLCVERTDTDATECTESNFEYLLNITDPKHGHGINLATQLSELTIERRKDRTSLVWLQVPHSALAVTGSENCSIMQIRPRSRKPADVDNCGKTVTLTLRVAADFTLAARAYTTVTGPGGTADPVPGEVIGTPYPVRITDLMGDRIKLSFDNDCAGTGCTFSDSEDLYEFVVHREGFEEIRFVTWSRNKAGSNLEPFITGDGERPPDFRAAQYIVLASPYGNCDPVSSEPPPGP